MRVAVAMVISIKLLLSYQEPQWHYQVDLWHSSRHVSFVLSLCVCVYIYTHSVNLPCHVIHVQPGCGVRIHVTVAI